MNYIQTHIKLNVKWVSGFPDLMQWFFLSYTSLIITKNRYIVMQFSTLQLSHIDSYLFILNIKHSLNHMVTRLLIIYSNEPAFISTKILKSITHLERTQCYELLKDAIDIGILTRSTGTREVNGKKIGNSRILQVNLPNYIFKQDESELLIMGILHHAYFSNLQLSKKALVQILFEHTDLIPPQIYQTIDSLLASKDLSILSENNNTILIPAITSFYPKKCKTILSIEEQDQKCRDFFRYISLCFPSRKQLQMSQYV